jgi:TetR/AcrR family transcriptional regulator, transcriptional repressor for nem operon
MAAVRYPAGHKQETRKRILAAAGERFRTRGYAATGVDEVMSAAGLTPGGFYGHFRSKDELLREALAAALEQTRGGLLAGLDGVEGPALLRAVVGRYLSRSHRDQPAAGCPLPALAAELAREGPAPRRDLQEYLERMTAALAPRVPSAPGLSPEDRVLATTALLAGALLLSRAVEDEELSTRILRASRRLAVPETAGVADAEEAARAPVPRKPGRKRSRR